MLCLLVCGAVFTWCFCVSWYCANLFFYHYRDWLLSQIEQLRTSNRKQWYVILEGDRDNKKEAENKRKERDKRVRQIMVCAQGAQLHFTATGPEDCSFLHFLCT